MLKSLKLSVFLSSVLLIINFDINAINTKDKVSIIIPIYNTEPYIEQCLDSAINQTHKNLEIICIDDCGNDNTIKIVENYKQKDKRIKIISNKTNKGASISRNVGVKNSTGSYIFFLDSDDYLNLDIIEKLVRKQKEKNFDLVISHTKAFLSNSNETDPMTIKRLQETQHHLNHIKKLKVIKKNEIQVSKNNFQECLFSIPVISCGKLYTKNFLISNNIWHVNKNIHHEDDGFNIKILSSFPKICILDDIGINYRIRKSSTSETTYSNRPRYMNHLKINLNNAFSFIKNHLDPNTANSLIKQTKTLPFYIGLFEKELSVSEKLFFWYKTCHQLFFWYFQIKIKPFLNKICFS